ncbi:MAG: ABC transporter permease subunit [Anaerocolumna sp.]
MKSRRKLKKSLNGQMAFQLMLLPGMVFLLLFHYFPMFGLLMAFQDYIPAKGILYSAWVGLDNFKFMFSLSDSRKIFVNTLFIAVFKIILSMLVPVVFALLLNELRLKTFKKTVQTIVYFPHFLSWAVLATVVSNMFSIEGPINSALSFFGAERILFLASNIWFRPIIILTDSWKEFGYGAIIYLVALTAIDPGLYEAAAIDGANRFQQVLHITLPSIIPTIVMMLTLSLGNILNAGFDQIFNLYNPLVYETGDIIDTYVYRIGVLQMQYSFSTAVGLMKSAIGFTLIFTVNKLSKRFMKTSIF